MADGHRPERCSSATTDWRVRAGTVEKKWIQSLDCMLKLDCGDQASGRLKEAAKQHVQ
jgi:hypothetical protein